MNKRKEPPRLEAEAHNKICSMVREVGVKWTRKLRSSATLGRHHWLRQVKSVEEECGQLRCILALLPVPRVLDIIVVDSVEEFTKIISSFNIDNGRPRLTTTYDRELHRDICSNMLKAVLLPCLYRCNIRNMDSEFIQELVINLLYLIPSVTALHLPSVYNKNYLRLLLERIPILNDLEEFHFHVGCTTAIVVKLSEYCTKLNKLSLEDCTYVDDDSVAHLLKLKNLLFLNVANTSISDEGYITLLSGLPKLQNVIWYNDIDVVLTYVSKYLLSVRLFVGRISNTRLLAQKCPNVVHLILLSIKEDMSGLRELSRVTDISIVQSSCTTINLGSVVRSMGSTLTKLDMCQVVNMNMDNLISYCTVLKILTIAYSHITGSEPSSFDHELPHFKHVQEIKLKQNWGTYDFCLLLHLYVNVEVCHVVGVDAVDDMFIGRLLTFGGFRRVTEFVIEYCGELSIPTAWLLMKNCPNISVLGNFRSWSGVSNYDLMEFFNFLKTCNLALIARM
jgi:hypothetical protein